MGKQKGRLKFGSRTAIVFLTIGLIVLFGWSIYHRHCVGSDQAVQWARGLGAKITFDWEVEGATFFQRQFPVKIDKRVAELKVEPSLDSRSNSSSISGLGTETTKVGDGWKDLPERLLSFTGLKDFRCRRFLTSNQWLVICKLKNLRVLDLVVNDAEIQIERAGRLPSLEKLKVVGRFGELENLSSLKKLQSLGLSNARFMSLDQVRLPASLKHLYLHKTMATNFSFLSVCPKLETLVIINSEIESPDLLSNYCSDLSLVSLHGTKIYDASVLEGLERLHTVDLQGTVVSNLKRLDGLMNLERVDARTTLVREIDWSKKSKKITELRFYPNRIKNLETTQQLKSLCWVSQGDGGRVMNLKPVESIEPPFNWLTLKVPANWPVVSD